MTSGIQGAAGDSAMPLPRAHGRSMRGQGGVYELDLAGQPMLASRLDQLADLASQLARSSQIHNFQAVGCGGGWRRRKRVNLWTLQDPFFPVLQIREGRVLFQKVPDGLKAPRGDPRLSHLHCAEPFALCKLNLLTRPDSALFLFSS